MSEQSKDDNPFWPSRYDDSYIRRLWLADRSEAMKQFQQVWPQPEEAEIEAVAKDHWSPAQARAIIFGGGRRGGKTEKMRTESERSASLESALQAWRMEE